MNVVFAGGGTGGHLYPGLALAEELRRREPDSHLLFLCTERDVDYPGLQAEGIETAVLPSRNHGLLPLRLAAMLPALWRAYGLLRRFRPDVVVGLGGYGSMAPVLCARLRRVPVLLLEQNVVPGRTNRMLVRLADEVASQWEEAVERFPCRHKVRVTGNPIRARVCRMDRAGAAATLGIEPHVPTLLIMGGSQGSSPVNEAVLGALPLLRQSTAPLQVVHLAGRRDAEAVRAAHTAAGVHAAVFDFVEDMAAVYSACDLALCRAGGTSIAELTALGVPAILVPLPHAKDNHQHLNASALASRGAAVLLEQHTLTANGLADCIAGLLGHRGRLAAMSAAMRDLGRPQAAAIVADRVAALARPGSPAVAAAGHA